MSETPARVILVDPSTSGHETLKTMLRGIDWAFLEAETHQYDGVLDLVAQTELDGVIIALDTDPALSLQLVKQIAWEQPQLGIIVVSDRPDLLVQAHRRGAKLLLDQPVKLEDLSVALKNLSGGISLHHPPRALAIAILGAGGGVGCTSLAVNIGSTLAQDRNKQVVLIDLDLVLGDAEVALDLVPDHRLSDVAGPADRLIDLQLLKSSLCRHGTGLYLLARSERLREIGLIPAENVQRILALLRVGFTHLVLDLSKGWSSIDLMAMRLADVIVLVAQPNLSSLRNSVLMLNALEEEGIGDKVRVVLNRVGAEIGGEEISASKAEQVVGRPISFQVPNDSRVLLAAWNEGIPLIQHAPKSKVHQSIAALAADLSKRPSRGPGNSGRPASSPNLLQHLRRS